MPCTVKTCALAVSLIALVTTGPNAVIAQNHRPQVVIDSGPIAGAVDDAGIEVFKGIPYAAPPVGNLRWKAPQPVAPWSAVRDAINFGNRCMQPSSPLVQGGHYGVSENCLFLNVWSSAKSTSAHLPVLVWIHGGGFSYGSSNSPLYDGDSFARRGLVYVSLNYRLGAFGFLAYPGLTKESPQKSSGNYGVLDQIAALQWVKRNIATFGGDPNNVTIFGESSGSISVSVLTASPLAKGLFKRGIGDSGASLGTTTDTAPVKPLAEAEKRGAAFAAVLHANSVAELRSNPAEAIAAAGENGPGSLFKLGRYAPVIDGYLLRESPKRTFARGKQNNVALITGWSPHEGAFFMLVDPTGQPVTGCKPAWNDATRRDAFVKQANASFGPNAEAFLRLYPHDTDVAASDSAEQVVGDLAIVWPTWKWADLQAQSGKTTVYLYLFGKSQPPENPIKVATHTSELPYVFNNLQVRKFTWDAMDRKLADMMSAYYADFAKTGDPNRPGLPTWPVYRSSNPQLMSFTENGAAAAPVLLAKLRLIDATPSAGPWCPDAK